jgi:hypothetical protein
MALTKHQKLARGMKRLSNALEIHCQKTASILNVLQFHFFETHWIIGRPLMSEETLQTMMRTHRYAMTLFSPNAELRSAAQHSPLIGCVLTPRFYLRSKVLVLPADEAENEKLAIPWGVKIVLPAESLQKLEDAKLEAFLYCASEDEMSEWIDWFEREDKAASLTNQLLVAEKDFQEKAMFEKNVRRLAMPFYRKSVVEYYRLPKGEPISKTLLKADFAPHGKSDIGTAYQLVSKSLAEHRKRHFEDFQRFWGNRLADLMFERMPWKEERRHTFLAEYFFPSDAVCKTDSSPRWETGSALGRQTYGVFIHYFSDRFIADPLKCQADGEIALLLWVMIYAARDLEKPTTIKKLLALTTANISDRYAAVDGGEIEFSCGLADLIRDYAGEGNLHRQQKLFPNLTIDRLEDHFRKASQSILPPDSIPALPEAFLTFPHLEKHRRMNSKSRRQQLKNPSEILHDPISLKELKRQLVEKSKLHNA